MDMEEVLEDVQTLKTGDEPADAGQEKRLSWEEILSDEHYRQCYDRAVQRIVQRRLRQRHEAEERLEALRPVLRALSRLYGVDAEAMESVSLAALIEEQAEKKEREQERFRAHLGALLAQEEEVKKAFPDFELMAALEDESFLRLSAPHTGLSLMQAYCALNREKIEARAAKQSMETLTRAVRAGSLRPGERRDRGGPEGFEADPRAMSKAEREALKKRIYEAKAMGKKLGYGG